MASEAEIKTAIEQVRNGSSYWLWTIGITDHPSIRKAVHGDPPTWHQWNADTEQAARNVEKYFISNRMQGGTGGQGKADYVYIF